MNRRGFLAIPGLLLLGCPGMTKPIAAPTPRERLHHAVHESGQMIVGAHGPEISYIDMRGASAETIKRTEKLLGVIRRAVASGAL